MQRDRQFAAAPVEAAAPCLNCAVMPTQALRPLSEGNRLQRAYARWAAPYYLRLPADTRADAELVDRFLYSRRGLGVWLGLCCAVAGSATGLRMAGLPWWLALLLSLLVWLWLPVMGLAAWLVPQGVTARKPLKVYLIGSTLCALGAVLGFATGHVARRGTLDLAELIASLVRNVGILAPVVLIVVLGLGLLMFGIAHIRRNILQQELERTMLAREAAEARLRLLQGQIQPHFIFNTLSALQHWVDIGDARAPALLRSLTAFLRGSTELLGRDETTLEQEAAMVGHYLAIQQARLGERLAHSIDIAPAVADEKLPPGLLLTLVENAVEHGISASLSGGTVSVSAEPTARGWRVCVRDDGVGLVAGWREGVGLANCRQRLHHHFGARAALRLTPQARGADVCITVERPAA